MMKMLKSTVLLKCHFVLTFKSDICAWASGTFLGSSIPQTDEVHRSGFPRRYSRCHLYVHIFVRFLFILNMFLGDSYDHFCFAYGFTSSTNHALSASGSILTPISWPQRYSQRSWRGLWSSAIYEFWYPQERTISVRDFFKNSLWNKGVFILIKFTLWILACSAWELPQRLMSLTVLINLCWRWRRW